MPDGLVLPPVQALVEAQRLLDEGLPFHAHEILEGVWKTAPAGESDLWQGLVQLAVGLTHLLRGNATGAATVLRRGQAKIAPYGIHPPYAIDVPGLLRWTTKALAAAASTPGTSVSELPPPRLRHRQSSE